MLTLNFSISEILRRLLTKEGFRLVIYIQESSLVLRQDVISTFIRSSEARNELSHIDACAILAVFVV
jgi:hypothetical protein